MKLLNGEIIFGRSEEQLKPCDFAVEESADGVDVADDLAGEYREVGFVLFLLRGDLRVGK
jgi:hypothetical protein